MFKQGNRRTVIVQGRLAAREWRLKAARGRLHGVQVISIEQMAARLAGGFLAPVDDDALRTAIQDALPVTPLGELDGIKDLPGMADAAADTLRRAWRAGIDLPARAGRHPRLDSMARLEAAVLARLPAGMMRPPDLAQAALQRVAHAAALLGQVEFHGLADLPPCWRALVTAVAAQTPTRWLAGPLSAPAWLAGCGVLVERSEPARPAVQAVSASTAYHEAIEAMRWARALLASGRAQAHEIAIAAVSPAEYDDHFLALRADACLDLHFVHGTAATASRDGQAAAALADILLRGLSQARMRRLATLCAGGKGVFASLPPGWTRILPADAPLTSVPAWERLLGSLRAEDWPESQDGSAALRGIAALLGRGTAAAAEIGEAVLDGRALAIWRKALLAGPAASLDATLGRLKQDDGLEACVSVAWMPASELAAAPRRFVRLLGLNSSRWPRGLAEDRLLSDHIVPSDELDPLPVIAADRHSFHAILATTADEVVLSRARRDGEGRVMGRSALLHGMPGETYLRRNAAPAHAFSETDRLLARPQEYHDAEQARSAIGCWRDWHSAALTAHDGVVSADHPMLQAVLGRTQSASSLQRLLRNPLGFLWQYGMRWRALENGAEPIVLDAMAFGNLVHLALDHALQTLEADGGLAAASPARVAAAARSGVQAAALSWEATQAVPPRAIWERALDEARLLAERALAWGDAPMPGTRAFGEVPFGGIARREGAGAALPWDAGARVAIPGTGFHIHGYIDRLDLAAGGGRAVVRDYKTGRAIKDDVRFDGGRELQRSLYAFAVKALLGDHVQVTASLLYPRELAERVLVDADEALVEVAGYLAAARASLLAGSAVIGKDTAGTYDDLAFALPANAAATYCKRKYAAALAQLGSAADVWDAK
ncbi:PD-(D/E)XK nuclease family protein [Cupriavidus sp. 30B13]|uniref:PD-(D/E)XK nuclease family protein n=1 Tax=Cupriavidus sp. 30B13 TaxID=3384241 RepID=UPI003B91AF91